MKKRIFILIDEVEIFIKKHKALRDSDERLMANIWAKYIGDIDFLNATDILSMLSKSELPSYESISRCRRKLQQECPELRGSKWEDRQGQIQKQVKDELNSFKDIRKKIKKAQVKRMEVKTTHPIGFEYQGRRK